MPDIGATLSDHQKGDHLACRTPGKHQRLVQKEQVCLQGDMGSQIVATQCHTVS